MRFALKASFALALAFGAAACGSSQEAVEDPSMGPAPTAAPMPEPAATSTPAPAETAMAAPTATAAAVAPPAKPDLVEWAEKSGSYPTFVAAVKAAGLDAQLKGAGPFTVFVPTEDAFKKVPKKDLEAWMKPENKEKLAKVLTYHVVPEKVLAADVAKLDKKTVKTVNGKELKVTVKGSDVMLDGKAKVVKTDLEAANGVAHEIDTVLQPK